MLYFTQIKRNMLMMFFKKIQSYLLVVLLALLVIVSLLIITITATKQFVEARAWTAHTNAVISKINDFALNVQNAEKFRLRALLTNHDQYFVRYIELSHGFMQDADTLNTLIADNPIQQKRVQNLYQLIEQLAVLNRTSLASQKASIAKNSTAKKLTSDDLLLNINNEMSETLIVMKTNEERFLATRYENASSLLERLKRIYFLLIVAFGALVILAYFLYKKANLSQATFEESLISNQALTRVNLQNISIMSEMSNLLLACRDTTESFVLISHFAQKIIQSDAGAMYLYWESRNQLERKAEWGENLQSQAVFEPNLCWALRRGQMHVHDNTLHTVSCGHIMQHAHVSSVCIPISAQGVVQGAIYFQRSSLSTFTDAEQQLLSSFSSQVALALANMRLKDTLRDQSIRDPLTGLFNRRFMEENLQQIMSNAVRKNLQFGIVMLDIDHFKQFNDTYGHDAGDVILREIGQLLKNTMRGSDTACRYGGEEFVLIYTENTLEFVEKRSAELLKKIESLNIQYLGNSLGIVTASIGIAIYPAHGNTTEALIRSADSALYQAKASGRNQLKIANQT